VDNRGTLTSKPSELVLASGDGNYLLTKLHWRGRGTGTTTATGVAKANTCAPNCAAGTFRSYLIAVSATKTDAPRESKVLHAADDHVPGRARPEGIAKRGTHTLGC